MPLITLRGKSITVSGHFPIAGEKAPDFYLVDKKLNDISLSNFENKKKLLNIVPSIDTEVCARSTKKFNDAAKENDQVVFLTISSDLPFAMKRFCKTEQINNVITLSMMRSRKFAKDYGVLINSGPLAGITARAVLIIDENNTVIYSEQVTEISQDPNYEAALAAL